MLVPIQDMLNHRDGLRTAYEEQLPKPAAAEVGFGRIVASEKEVLNMLANLV
jgi:hypothetical protein